MTPSGNDYLNLYRQLLRFYPHRFRVEFEEEMLIVFSQSIEEASKKNNIDLLAIFLRELKDWPTSLMREYIHVLRQRMAKFISPDLVEMPGLVPVVQSGKASIPFWITQHTHIRRSFDLVIATSLSPITSPLILLAMIAVRLESKGPIFFRQLRIGKNGQPYTHIKLRTMAEVIDPITGKKIVTRTGDILRRCHLDELPQLINVIRGNVSIFGNRPRQMN